MTERGRGRWSTDAVVEAVHELGRARGRPVGVHIGPVGVEQPPAFYEMLSDSGVRSLDLVLSTSGGSVSAARRLALLLREMLDDFRVLVADSAISAGTVLCLAADEIVMGPLAELGPIDPQTVQSSGADSGPSMISSEDLRRFPEMADVWFGLGADVEPLQKLALVAQRIFPTTLTTMYRSEQMTRSIARSLLRYQLADAEEETLDDIARSMIVVGGSHEYGIFRDEAEALGLRVRRETAEEERRLWDFVAALRTQVDTHRAGAGEYVLGLSVAGGWVTRIIETRHPDGGFELDYVRERHGHAAPPDGGDR